MSCPFAAVFQFHPSGLWEVVNGQRLGAENYGHSLALDVLQEELVGVPFGHGHTWKVSFMTAAFYGAALGSLCTVRALEGQAGDYVVKGTWPV